MIDQDKLLFVVDEDNNPQEPKSREEVHKNRYWHRTSHIWIINSQKQILCQKRSLLKDSNPGKWEAFFGGHMAPDTEYIDNAINELNEELGIMAKKDELQFFKVYKCVPGKEFQAVYALPWDGKAETLKLEKEEIDQVRWIPFEEIYEILLGKQNNKWSKMGYEKELFEYLEKSC